MNLMFWKKKSGAEEEAEALAANAKPRESLDFVAPGQGSAGQNPEPARRELSDADGTSLEPPAKPRLAERMKSLLGGLAGYFRRTPAFHAEIEPEVPEEEYQEGGPVRSRKRLIVAGAIGLLVLLLAGIVIAIWPDSEPLEQAGSQTQSEQPQEQPGTRHEAAAASGTSDAEPAPPGRHAEIEALRKENAELQAKIEELKKGQAQQRAAAPAGKSTPLSSVGGEMAVGSSDPRAAAMTLKEAIEAMNAASGDYPKKPAK